MRNLIHRVTAHSPFALALLLTPLIFSAEMQRTIIDEQSATNLGIQTEVVQRRLFAETLFALGHIEPLPTKRAVVSSRINGRIIDLAVHLGQTVSQGQRIATVESLLPGNPPPRNELKAPIGGIVTSTSLLLGSPVEASSTLLEIMDLSEVYAIAQVPEDKVDQIKHDARASVQLPSVANQSFSAQFLRFGPLANEKNATLDAYFLIANQQNLLKPHARAEFSIVVEEHPNVFSIAKEAIQGEEANPFVFVADFDLPNVYLKSPIQIGRRNDTHAEILSGLFPGDRVVTKGAYPLSYVGGAGLSLKDALDAAHGHEHNDDGSEMTPEQRATSPSSNLAEGMVTPWNGLTATFAAIALALAILLMTDRSKARAGL